MGAQDRSNGHRSTLWRSREVVRVFDEDRDLLWGVPPALADQLRRMVTADVLHFARGPILAPPAMDEATVGWLLISGFLTRRVTLATRSSCELLGGGDIVRPWQDDGALSTLPVTTTWRALTPLTVAVLDAEFARTAQRVPALSAQFASRLLQRSHAMAVRLAIAQMPRLATRLHALLWHLADRWGTVDGDGVTLALRLSHGTLAELVSAQRPSVSVAMHELEASGLVQRAAVAGWKLYAHAKPGAGDLAVHRRSREDDCGPRPTPAPPNAIWAELAGAHAGSESSRRGIVHASP
jgi:CRP-like cAMP-binding protein